MAHPLPSKSTESRRANWLRLAGFLLVMTAIACVTAARHVRAQVDDFMLSAGSRMMQLGKEGAPPRILHLNGAQLHVRAQFLRDAKLEQVLDVLEARCKERGTQLDAGVDKLFRDTKKLGKSGRALFDGVLRTETEKLGALACLDTGGAALSSEDLSKRVTNFLRSLDVADVGQLRYMRAEQHEKGVQLLMTWSEGPLNLKQMFPGDGDAPGVELGELPRPPASRRILSAWEEGADPAVNSYLAPRTSIAELERFYDAQLGSLGYEFLTPKATTPASTTRSIQVMKGGRSAVIALTQRGQDVLVTLAPDGVRGAAAMRAAR